MKKFNSMCVNYRGRKEGDEKCLSDLVKDKGGKMKLMCLDCGVLVYGWEMDTGRHLIILGVLGEIGVLDGNALRTGDLAY